MNDSAHHEGRWIGVFLALLFLAFLLPSLDRSSLQEVDELIYGRVSLEAARDAHWAPLTCGGTVWSEKPPLLLWAAAWTAKASGQLYASWPYRLWSCLGAALALFAVARLISVAAGSGAAFIGALLLALQGDFLFHARFFSMDTAALGCALMATLSLCPRPRESAIRPQAHSLAGAGIWLLVAVWIKSWFVLAFVPALIYALLRNYEGWRRSSYIAFLFFSLALALASATGYYVYVYGSGFLIQDFFWNLLDRAKGLSNVHLENNWSFYSHWAQESAGALLPLVLAAPLGVLAQKRREGPEDFVADFSVGLCISWLLAFCFVQAQVINYLLPLEAGLCLCWGILISRSHSLWLLLALLAACFNLHGACDPWSFFWLSGFFGLGFFVLPKFGSFGCLSRAAVLGLHLWLFAGLLFYAGRYLAHPDDPSGAVAQVLLEHPARHSGEPMVYVGPWTQALNFYSQYQIQRLPAPPPQKPKSAALLFLEGKYYFYPAPDDTRPQIQ